MKDDENVESLETEEKKQNARNKKSGKKSNHQAFKAVGALMLIVVLIAAVAVAIASHDKKTAENAITEAVFISLQSDSVKDLAPYPGGVVVLTSSDIEYIDRYGNLMTSNEHTFSSPVIKISGKDLIVYDRGGYSLKIERSSAKYEQLEFQSAISCADICSNGTYAYVLNSDGGYQSHLYVYSAKGKLKFEWGSTDYLLCLSLSKNGKYAAAGIMSVDNASFVSRVLLFDFSKSEPVYNVEFAGETVYDLQFVSSKKLAVLTDNGFYTLENNGTKNIIDEYSGSELCHSDMKKDGMIVTAVNLFGNAENVLAKAHTKNLKESFEHNFSSELTAVCAGESNSAFIFGNEIEIYDQKNVLTGTITLSQNCLKSTISDNRIFVCLSDGIYSYNVNEKYKV